MTYLEHLIEPVMLRLQWQQLDPATRRASGKRYVVGEVRQSRNGTIDLHYHENEETDAAKKLGFSGLTAFPVENALTYHDVGELLAKRLPPSSRSDYADFLRSYRLPTERAHDLSIMQLLAYTGGMLAGDGYSFAYSLEGVSPPFDFTFTIAGFRHNDGMKLPSLGSLAEKNVTLTHEPDNVHDANAIAVYCDEMKLGFVPKGLTTAMLDKVFNKYSYKATICRINGTPTNPNVMVMVRVIE